MDREKRWKMELEPKKNLGGYANSILCVGALSSLISSFALSGAEDTLASAHAAGAFWIFLALFVSCLLYTTQRAFSGNMMNTGVYMGLTLLTCGALASTCFVDANSVDLQTAVTIAGFAGPALVMMFVLMRVSLACQGKNNRMARFTNSKQFIAFGIYATAIVSTFVGGALFMSYSPEGITNFSGDYCLAVAFGLLFSVFIFYQCGSRNAGDDQFFQKGLFNANYSRVALTVFWTLSSAALGSTFLCSVFDGGATAFVPFQCSAGIAAVLFSIMYLMFFNWQGNEGNYTVCEKAMKITTIMGTSIGLGMILLSTIPAATGSGNSITYNLDTSAVGNVVGITIGACLFGICGIILFALCIRSKTSRCGGNPNKLFTQCW